MKYEIKYDSIYREKEWVTLTKEIEANSDAEAIKMAQKFVRELNKNKGIERFELRRLIRIDQEKRATIVL